jgi:uncharacterized protein YukE
MRKESGFMAQQTALTGDAAKAQIVKINDARDVAVGKLASIRDSQEGMLASSWQGGSATAYGKTSAQQQEDFTQIINTLNDIVDKTNGHLNRIITADNH